MDLLYRKREAHYELIVSQRRSHCTQWLEKDRIMTMFQIKNNYTIRLHGRKLLLSAGDPKYPR